MGKERNIANINNTHFVSTYQLCEPQVRGHAMEERNIANINTTAIHTLPVLTGCVSHRYEVTQWRRETS